MCRVLATCPQPPVLAAPAPDRPRYVLRVNVARSLRTVTGTVDVTFSANRATDKLVFRLWPNAPRSRDEGVRLDVGPVHGFPTARPNPTTLVVRLRGDIGGRVVRVRIPWTLHVPRAGFDRITRFNGGLLLGSFFPILAWDARRGWVMDAPAKILAESSTSPVADFTVRVRAPRGLTAVVSDGHAVRDVAVAVGRFAFASAAVHRVHVRVAVARGGAASPKAILGMATSALTRLSQRYGAYPWSRYTVVVPPGFGAGGIEYPTLSFVGASRLARVVVDHETGHQWFYSLVGNDQAHDPWLDETLATWVQQQLDGQRRPPPPLPSAARRHVGEPVNYWTRFPRAYFWGVYEEGANALRSLGDDAAVDCALRHYVARRAYSIAQPGDLLDELNRFIPGAERRLRAWGIHR
jgi:peptidase M1-like protein